MMRQLIPVPVSDAELDDAALRAFYASGWLEAGGIRVDMVASADGAAAYEGRSRGLQTRGDNRVYAVQRDLADVIVAGLATAQIEGYRPVRLSDDQRAVRAELGLGAQVPTAVLTRHLDCDPSDKLFQDRPGAARSIVITCASSDADARAKLAERATVLVCGDDEIDFGEMRRQLGDRGLTRVLAEGGLTVLGLMLAAGGVDELCLSVTPIATGPGAPRIVDGQPWASGPVPLTLTGLLEDDGALFLRLRTG